MCKYLKPCLYIAGGVVSVIVGIKLIVWWDRRRDSPPSSPTRDTVKDDESEVGSSSSEEIIKFKLLNGSRSGHTFETTEVRKRIKISHMRKEQLIKECDKRGLSTDGTVRVLRSRLKSYKSE